MAQWFICKVKYDKTTEDGMIKSVTEPYLVDALSFTEAESRIIDVLKPYISAEYSVEDIKKAKIADLFTSDAESDDKWYNCKVVYISIDEVKGIEKRIQQTTMVQAGSMRAALSNLEDGMKGTLGEWEVTSITETKILDVFPYDYENPTDNKEE